MATRSRLFALEIGCLLSVVCSVALSQDAAGSPPYFNIDPPRQTIAGDKIEVAEVFSYACIHCFQFQTLIDAWRKRLPRQVAFVYLPAPYNARDILLARGYLAAASLGIAEDSHSAIFDAIHVRHVKVQSIEDVAALYAAHGVTSEAFLERANSFLIATQLRNMLALMVAYRIDSTPTLIVAGKYRVTASSAGNPENMLKVADQLIAKEIAQTATSRQAPSKGK